MGSPKIGKYLIKRKISRYLITGIDAILKVFCSTKTSNDPIEKILICNLAHFGDLVISTCILPPLKHLFPKAQIGFLCSTATRVVVEKHPLVDFVHSYDHWYLNGFRKARYRTALKEIGKIGYSAAFHLSSGYPNAIGLTTRAKIAHRIGYESGGFSPLLNRSFSWDHEHHYTGYSHLHLLKGFGNLPDEMKSPLPYYPKGIGIPPKGLPLRYIVLHLSASTELKDWPLDSWRALAEKMALFHIPIVITGKGDCDKAKYVSKNLHYVINLSNRCNWFEFVYTIQHATLLISPDSVASHLAASEKIPTILLFAGMNSSLMWAPPYPECKPLQYSVPCSPCFQRKGCKAMSCIRDISVDVVLKTVTELLQKRG